jgi:PAS domain S-box-containing protein
MLRQLTTTRISDQLCAVMEAAPIGMLVVKADGTISFANAHIERLFGYEHGELVGDSLERLVPSGSREFHPRFREEFLRSPSARTMGLGRDLYGVRKDGSEVPVEIGLSPIQTEEGMVVLSSVVDITERKRSEERFRMALEAAPTGMILVDSDGRIALVNRQIELAFGYAREELIGQAVESLVPERLRGGHSGYRIGFFKNPETRPMGHGRELYGRRKDGSEIPVEIGLNPLTTSSGQFVLSSIVDISERKFSIQRLQEQSAALTATLKEREVLLQEIHHRVKNNLQIIASLINMQMRRLETSAEREMLNECKTRVDAIALIHEKLYQSRDFRNVPFADYARGLIATIFQASGLTFDRISVHISIENVLLPVAQAIPCGLIVNELVTNSIKHAFPQQRSGRIEVSLTQAGENYTLIVSDDGIGMSTVDLSESSIGLQLVANLADQLNGRLSMETGAGVAATIKFTSPQH